MSPARGLAFALLAAGTIAGAPAAHAQTQAPSDGYVDQLTLLARASLPMGRLEDGSPVPEETPEELARPIISRTLETQVVRRGELSGLMQWCGLDWQQLSFMPMMIRLRASGWRGKRMAYVGMLHGMTQGMTLRDRRDRPACTSGEKSALKRESATLDLKID